MARHYHVDIAVFAADTDRKWVDNLLSHFDVPGVDSARQGVARRISLGAIYHIVLVRELSHAAGFSVETGLRIARQLLADDEPTATLTSELVLRFDRPAFQRRVDSKVESAVESMVPRRRGRPPGPAKG